MTAMSPDGTSGESKEGFGESNIAKVKTSMRKVNKPLMEKRRRARINNSLTILKKLVIDDTKSQEDNKKLEKADILDLVISHVEKLHHNQQHHPCFNEGYECCFSSIVKFLRTQKCSSLLVTELNRFVQPNIRSSLLEMDEMKTPTYQPETFTLELDQPLDLSLHDTSLLH